MSKCLVFNACITFVLGAAFSIEGKTAVVFGAGGFIGHHLVRHLKKEGYWVRGVDLKRPEYSSTDADDFILGDLRDFSTCMTAVMVQADGGLSGADEVYQLAADMGGMGYIAFHAAKIVHDNVLINVHTAEACRLARVSTVFFASSACVYPEHNQLDPENPMCSEDSAYPAAPDTDYGWEKLFSERIYQAYERDYGMQIRIARFHNIFGPEGTWCGGREKAPAALSRKVALTAQGGAVDIWGKGDQTRSFLYIDECIDGIRRLMCSNISEPLNIGSEEMIAINDLAKLIAHISGKNIEIQNVPGPEGVRGRNSHNHKIRTMLAWEPSQSLEDGLRKTYAWVEQQIMRAQLEGKRIS